MILASFCRSLSSFYSASRRAWPARDRTDPGRRAETIPPGQRFDAVSPMEKQIRGSGGSPGPPGPLPMHVHTVYMEYSECLPTLLTPLAERTCFSQVTPVPPDRQPGRLPVAVATTRIITPIKVFDTVLILKYSCDSNLKEIDQKRTSHITTIRQISDSLNCLHQQQLQFPVFQEQVLVHAAEILAQALARNERGGGGGRRRRLWEGGG
jgi:hypothetical protein